MILEEALKEAPEGRPVRVLFQDESRFGRLSDPRRCWAPSPTRPIVGQQVVREFLYTLAAVSPQDGRLASLILPWVDAETMSIFLAHTADEFLADFCLMFLDGAGWHRAGALRVPKNIKLVFLPPYSPELNPVEPLWDHLRENYIGNRVFHSLEKVERELCAGLRNLMANPEIVRSMSCFDWLEKAIWLT